MKDLQWIGNVEGKVDQGKMTREKLTSVLQALVPHEFGCFLEPDKINSISKQTPIDELSRIVRHSGTSGFI